MARDNFSIEHKIPWLDSDDPVDLFFNLENIDFSHLLCNSAAKRIPHKKYFTEEERLNAIRKSNTEGSRKRYDPEKRRLKFKMTGH